MRMMLGWALWFASFTAVEARDVFVNNNGGDDRATGLLAESSPDMNGPVRTIAKALRLAQLGDRIVLAANEEPYRESISLVGERHSGLEDYPFVIEGNGALLDGSMPVPPNAWNHVRGEIFAFQPPRLGYQQLFLDGRPLLRKPATSLNWSVPELAPMEWALAAGKIHFRAATGQIPQNYSLSCAGLQTGITLCYVHDVVIRNLIVQGFQVDGINAHDAVHDGRLIGVTARGNGRAGVTVSGGSRFELAECVLGDNGVVQLRAESYSQTQVFDTDLIANTGPAYVIDDARLFIDSKEVGPEEEPAQAVEKK